MDVDIGAAGGSRDIEAHAILSAHCNLLCLPVSPLNRSIDRRSLLRLHRAGSLAWEAAFAPFFRTLERVVAHGASHCTGLLNLALPCYSSFAFVPFTFTQNLLYICSLRSGYWSRCPLRYFGLNRTFDVSPILLPHY